MASTRNLARDVILQRCYFYLCASSILCCAFFRSLSRLLFFLLNVIIVSDHRNIFSEKTSNQYVSRYILNIHSTNISNKRKRKSGYLSLFSFLSPSPVAMVIDNIRCAVSSFVHILCFLLSFWEKPEQEERERKREKKTYFGTSGYSQEDSATAVLFADNLSRGNIHVRLFSSIEIAVLTNKYV